MEHNVDSLGSGLRGRNLLAPWRRCSKLGDELHKASPNLIADGSQRYWADRPVDRNNLLTLAAFSGHDPRNVAPHGQLQLCWFF